MGQEEIDLGIFKKKLKEIRRYKGRHTELISLYIPNGTDRSSVMNQLTQEISQSSNIKSAQTRKNVQGALRKITQYLKVIDFNIPKTGLVLFSGNISEIEGKNDIRIFHVTALRNLGVKLYRCDSSFYTDPLDEMVEPDKIYGIVAIDNKEATIATLIGKKYNILARLTSAVPGKIKAGGQSAARYERLRQEAANEFYVRISETINKEYLKVMDKLQGVIFGGPGHSKKKLVEKNELDYRVSDKIIGFVDVTYTDESGIKEIVESSEDMLRETEMLKETKMVKKFLNAVVTTGLASYGLKEVLGSINEGRVDTILISEGFEIEFGEYECQDCSNTFQSTTKDVTCKKCGSKNVELIDYVDPAEYFSEIAKKRGTNVVIISRETDEGEQFFKGFGGLGAILRY